MSKPFSWNDFPSTFLIAWKDRGFFCETKHRKSNRVSTYTSSPSSAYLFKTKAGAERALKRLRTSFPTETLEIEPSKKYLKRFWVLWTFSKEIGSIEYFEKFKPSVFHGFDELFDTRKEAEDALEKRLENQIKAQEKTIEKAKERLTEIKIELSDFRKTRDKKAK